MVDFSLLPPNFGPLAVLGSSIRCGAVTMGMLGLPPFSQPHSVLGLFLVYILLQPCIYACPYISAYLCNLHMGWNARQRYALPVSIYVTSWHIVICAPVSENDDFGMSVQDLTYGGTQYVANI